MCSIWGGFLSLASILVFSTALMRPRRPEAQKAMEISGDDDVTGDAPGGLINAVQGESIVVEVNAVPGGNDVGVPSVSTQMLM